MSKRPTKKKRKTASVKSSRGKTSSTGKTSSSRPNAKKTVSKKSTTSKPARKAKSTKRTTTSKLRKRAKRKSASSFQLPRWARLLGGFFYRVAFVCFLGLIAGICGLYYFSRDLPSITTLESQVRPSQISILDKDGELITHYGNVYGQPVAIAELPPHVVQAFVATEDRNFYHHMGVNPLAILRALIVNVRSGDIRQGGSTITQQFAKNVFLTPEKTIDRKIQEALLAFRLEMKYSKDEILALYLNNVYFGAGAYGLRSASHRYFDKPPSKLTVGEAALLAGLLKAPSRYSPSSRPDAARDRARIVVQAMFDAGYVTREKMNAILAGPIAVLRIRDNPAPYATDHVMAELARVYGQVNKNIVVHTTLNLESHKKASDAIAALPIQDTRFKDDIQVGLIALEADGAIRLLVGGRDYAASQYNRVTHAKRQPGSAFKPFVYLAALEAGRQPDDIILDTPIELGKWNPSNYKDKYYGAVEMSEAMARSLNAAVIRLQEEIGREEVVSVARRVGFAGIPDPGAALALGVNETTPLELARVYIPFANEGYSAEPYIITSVYTDAGDPLYVRNISAQQQVISSKPLVAMNHMLRQVVSMGSGQKASLTGYVTAGKTGTTQDSRDAWFVGHAAGLVGVVWLGKDDYTPMTKGWSPVSGSGTPAILWNEMMLATLDGRPDTPVTLWQPRRRLPSLMDRLRQLISGEAELEGFDSNGAGQDVARNLPVAPAGASYSSAKSMEELLQDVITDDDQSSTEQPPSSSLEQSPRENSGI